jgi:hypothetical protein
MSGLTKSYEVIKNPPREIDWVEYHKLSVETYQDLLQKSGDDEKAFQEFFEKNPSFLPGALELFGQSGHYPYMSALISQPCIGTVFEKIPDFLWLAQDSLTFCPVFIEIEKPNKKMFTQTNTPTADFTQAMNQIHEWKMILNKPANIQVFYETFDIPLEMRKKEFKPQFLLVYGRRSEYEGDEYRTGIRKENEGPDMMIASYDRLQPLSDSRQFVTCKVSKAKYHIISIPGTFRYRADCVKDLYSWIGFKEHLRTMENVSEERRQFLIDRFEYWKSFQGRLSGTIISMEGE